MTVWELRVADERLAAVCRRPRTLAPPHERRAKGVTEGSGPIASELLGQERNGKLCARPRAFALSRGGGDAEVQKCRGVHAASAVGR